MSNNTFINFDSSDYVSSEDSTYEDQNGGNSGHKKRSNEDITNILRGKMEKRKSEKRKSLKVVEDSEDSSESVEEKCGQKCGKCGKNGHNKRTCQKAIEKAIENESSAVEEREIESSQGAPEKLSQKKKTPASLRKEARDFEIRAQEMLKTATEKNMQAKMREDEIHSKKRKIAERADQLFTKQCVLRKSYVRKLLVRKANNELDKNPMDRYAKATDFFANELDAYAEDIRDFANLLREEQEEREETARPKKKKKRRHK